MVFILNEGEASVLGFVSSTGIHDHIHDPICDLLHLRQDLITLLGFRNPAHKQAAVVNTSTDPKKAAISVASKKIIYIKKQHLNMKCFAEFVSVTV